MNIVKDKVSGIDIPIQRIQSYVYDTLLNKWPVDARSYNAYGRVYRNQEGKGYTPEVYKGKNEYSDTFFDDSLKASSFFAVGESISVQQETNQAEVSLVFMVNLDKVKPGATRNDEEARVDVQRILTELSFNVTGFVTGIANVFKEYNIDQIKFRDQHPLHCFRINFKLIYNIFNC